MNRLFFKFISKPISLIIVILYVFSSELSFSQGRGVKIGYIDMEYILEHVPDYQEALDQLEKRASKWKNEIEKQKLQINTLKDNLEKEKPLLTDELIQEREEEIKLLVDEMIQYQEDRFGPKGDLFVQKSTIVKPVQDQVFNLVQDFVERKKFDFIFDISSHQTILYANSRYNVSDLIIKKIEIAKKRSERASKKTVNKLEDDANKMEEEINKTPQQIEREKKVKQARQKAEDLRNQKLKQREELKKERLKLIEERKAKNLLKQSQLKDNGTTIDNEKPKE